MWRRGRWAGTRTRTLRGTVVERDQAETIRLYGKPWSNRDILRGGVSIPDPAKVLTIELGRDFYKK
jgi:hypothetical protein